MNKRGKLQPEFNLSELKTGFVKSLADGLNPASTILPHLYTNEKNNGIGAESQKVSPVGLDTMPRGLTHQTLLHSGHDAGRSTAFVQCRISHKDLSHNVADPVHHSLLYLPTNQTKGNKKQVKFR